jgi:hypothetical protein
MVTVCITAAPYEAIEGRKPDPVVYDELPRRYPITLDGKTIDRLNVMKLNESLSDVILRVVREEGLL